jgi:hypothetical protein
MGGALEACPFVLTVVSRPHLAYAASSKHFLPAKIIASRISVKRTATGMEGIQGSVTAQGRCGGDQSRRLLSLFWEHKFMLDLLTYFTHFYFLFRCSLHLSIIK